MEKQITLFETKAYELDANINNILNDIETSNDVEVLSADLKQIEDVINLYYKVAGKTERANIINLQFLKTVKRALFTKAFNIITDDLLEVKSSY